MELIHDAAAASHRGAAGQSVSHQAPPSFARMARDHGSVNGHVRVDQG